MGYRLFALVTVVVVAGALLAVAEELRLRPSWSVAITAALLASSPLLGTVALGQVYGVLAALLVGSWLAARRDRQWLAGAVASVVAGTTLGLVVAGPYATVRWLRLVLAEPLSTFGDNASLPAVVTRLGGPTWLGIVLGAVAVALTVRLIWLLASRLGLSLYGLILAVYWCATTSHRHRPVHQGVEARV